MEKLLFILNPRSGKNQIKPIFCDIIDMYVAAGYEVTIHTTQYHRDAYEVARARGGDYDFVVCSGGDGTVDEVISGLMELDKQPRFGYIPAGTTNDYAKSLGIPTKMLEAAENTLHGVPSACDIGVFNGEYFIYVAAFGIFSDVSYQTSQESKNLIGHMAYILEGFKSLTNVKSYQLRIEYDDVIVEDEFIFGMVTNSISVGGFKSVSGKDMLLDDGLFEMLLVKMPHNVLDLQAIIGALILQKVDEKHMIFARTKEVTFVSEEGIAWTLDGEEGGVHYISHIVNKQQAIEIVRPLTLIEK